MSVVSKNFQTHARSILSALEDPSVIEVMLDTNQEVYAEVIGRGFVSLGKIDDKEAFSFLAPIAHSLSTVVGPKSPIIEGELPVYGYRIAAAVPPVVASPIFTIRKPAERIIRLQEYVDSGTMDVRHLNLIEKAIVERKNLVVAGGVGSGKTTLANALLASIAELNPDHRVLIMEDTRELQFKGRYGSVLRTSKDVSLLDLSRLALRCRPDRIVIGEVRTGEVALNALKALSTGTPGGLFTIHADSSIETLCRLEELILEVSSNQLSTLVGRAVDLVVFMERGSVAGTRKVRELLEVEGFDRATGNYVFNQL